MNTKVVMPIGTLLVLFFASIATAGITIDGTEITFSDMTTQSTAPTGGGGSLVRTVVVSPVPGDSPASGTALLDAITGISDATPTNLYLVKIEPGIYDLGATALTMKSYVHVEGSGVTATIILGAATSVVEGADDSEIRNLSVATNGAGVTRMAVRLASGAGEVFTMRNVVAAALSGSNENDGVTVRDEAELEMFDCVARGLSGTFSVGAFLSTSGILRAKNCEFLGSGGTNSDGVEFGGIGTSSATLRQCVLEGDDDAISGPLASDVAFVAGCELVNGFSGSAIFHLVDCYDASFASIADQ